MSPNTVTQRGVEIREGLTGAPGSSLRRVINGIVDGHVVVTAFEALIEVQRDGAYRWFLATFPDIAHTAGVAHPTSLPVIGSEDQIRPWVEFFTALYAKAIADQGGAL